ncbi:hypothetical protein BDN72DRAFT_962696 [Pluteus cervinus]|uniref:Uncharacterized protein n=1 Tax=Pluteus cervinus TaxID=181527 RepID=A0ACD3AIJ2_9AGAR|nr:hypothetical protein BDN72DRAFT_962696 [Pluteus cervinus]
MDTTPTPITSESPQNSSILSNSTTTATCNSTTPNISQEGSDVVKPSDSPISEKWPDGKRKAWQFYILRISAAFALLIAPWIFHGVVVHSGQLALSRPVAEKVAKNPQTTTQVVVTLAGIVSMAVTFLFGAAVVCVAQKWVTTATQVPTGLANSEVLATEQNNEANSDRLKRTVRIKHLARLANIGGLRPVFAFNSWRAVGVSIVAVLLYVACNQALAGISAMFTPQPLSLTTALTGSEVDFSSTNPTCLDWYEANPPPQVCGYVNSGGVTFTTCLGENQLFDVIQAGRDNAALVRPSVPTMFPRMNGIRFLGSFPGVLLTGPNGLNFSHVFTDNPHAFSDSPIPGISYNYSLPLQSTSISISCGYQDTTILGVHLVDDLLQWNASCPPSTSDFLLYNNLDPYWTSPSNFTMDVWACKQDLTFNGSLGYSLYLRGVNPYLQTIGNTTCIVNVALADYTIEYLGAVEYFTAVQGPNVTERASEPSSVFAEVFDEVVRRNVDLVINSQTVNTGNLVTEIMLANGAEYYGLDQMSRDSKYMAIFSAILQGMLDYQAGYLRLLYSGEDSTLPQNCFRAINGTVSYPGVGWSAHAGQFNPSGGIYRYAIDYAGAIRHGALYA